MQGVGVYQRGKYVCTIKGVRTKEYQLWMNMLLRCYSHDYQNKWPTYIGCSVSDNFKNFQYFAEWCNNQVGFKLNDYALDKDILFPFNKVYSEKNCVFVPRELNNLLNIHRRNIGEYPTGVNYYKKYGNFQASIKMYGKRKNIGYYSTPEEASFAYQTTKESHVKALAITYKDLIDHRVYSRLLDFKVSVT